MRQASIYNRTWAPLDARRRKILLGEINHTLEFSLVVIQILLSQFFEGHIQVGGLGVVGALGLGQNPFSNKILHHDGVGLLVSFRLEISNRSINTIDVTSGKHIRLM